MDGVAATTRSDQTRYDTTQLETTVTALIRNELPIGRQVPTAVAREEPWEHGRRADRWAPCMLRVGNP